MVQCLLISLLVYFFEPTQENPAGIAQEFDTSSPTTLPESPREGVKIPICRERHNSSCNYGMHSQSHSYIPGYIFRTDITRDRDSHRTIRRGSLRLVHRRLKHIHILCSKDSEGTIKHPILSIS
ncbi:hypothetical protein V6N13_101367 [Hibiscus sabdariffa]|uniref:Uncharacterized protein n=1 Tax=Hibiscus sabdariffa TaxID=183260 RepID=A0ABR2QL47_9ROSI